jgi:hypothetical protein
MSQRAKVEVALTLVVGICLVVVLPTLQLLPATTRAWRRAMVLIPSVRRIVRAAAKLSASSLNAWLVTPSKEIAFSPPDILSMDCARLC